MMEVSSVIDRVIEVYKDVVIKDVYGETTFFYNKDSILPHGVYFLALKEQDGPNDKQSYLDRSLTYRLSWCIGKDKFRDFFGDVPDRKKKDDFNFHYDFSEKNKLLPHPIYAWMSWVMILSPDIDTFQKYEYLIGVSYQRAVEKYKKRVQAF